MRQRAAPAVDAAHPAERQVGRPDQETADLLVAQAQLAADLLPHRLLPVTASGMLMPCRAIQSIIRSHCGQSHQAIV